MAGRRQFRPLQCYYGWPDLIPQEAPPMMDPPRLGGVGDSPSRSCAETHHGPHSLGISRRWVGDFSRAILCWKVSRDVGLISWPAEEPTWRLLGNTFGKQCSKSDFREWEALAQCC